MKVHNSVICSFQPQIFMCFNFLRMVSNTIIPRNSVANQNTVDFTVWNGMVPLYVECRGACVVVSDNFWTNRGNCVKTRDFLISHVTGWHCNKQLLQRMHMRCVRERVLKCGACWDTLKSQETSQVPRRSLLPSCLREV